MVNALVMVLLFLTSLFLILLVLVQRGRGGGLAGAFGGLGGQSAFGTKAGDLFTRITIGVAFVWILLCMAAVKWLGGGSEGPLSQSIGGGATMKPGVQAPLSPQKQPAGAKSEAPAAPAKTPAKSEGKP
jgi:preprotein translocase subunit SecG